MLWHCIRKFRRRDAGCAWLLIFLAATACAAAAGAPSAMVSADSAYTHAQQQVAIGAHRRLNLYCVGAGAPTVIFESGLSDWSFTWAHVQPRIAGVARACSYDRAGLGYSDAASRAGSSSNMVDDLHRLLRAARVAPPYVLVGHSLGGLNATLFTDRYPSEVAALVLVDPVRRDSIARLDAQARELAHAPATGAAPPPGPETRYYSAQVARFRRCAHDSVAQGTTAAFRTRCIEPPDPRYSAALNQAREAVARRPTYQRAQLSENVHYLNSAREVAPVWLPHRFGAVPLIVLTAANSVTVSGLAWRRMQAETAALSERGIQCLVPDAGHYIQLDRPDVVIAAIAAVVAHVRAGGSAGRPALSCGALD